MAPVTLDGKLLMQQLWAENVDWDEEIPTNQRERWRKIANEIRSLHKNAIPRCVSKISVESKQFTISCFCDAS